MYVSILINLSKKKKESTNEQNSSTDESVLMLSAVGKDHFHASPKYVWKSWKSRYYFSDNLH